MKSVIGIIVIVIVNSLINSAVYAQEGLLVGASGSYIYSYRHLVEQGNVNSIVKKQRDKLETPLSSFKFDVNVLYQFKNKVNLSSAISLSNNGYQIKSSDVTTGDQIGKNGFSEPGVSVKNLKIRNRFVALSIPVMIGYHLSVNKSHKHLICFHIGLTNNLLLKPFSKIETEYTDGSVQSSSINKSGDYKIFYLSALGRIGYLYKLNNHSVGVSILGDYALTPLNKNTTVIKQYQYYGGVELSYFYNLN